MQNRENALQKWLTQLHFSSPFSLSLLADDASFRRYFRVQSQDKTHIVMDAPPEKETLDLFLHINQALHQTGLLVPQIEAFDLEQGFVLMQDFGDTLLLNALSNNTVDKLYSQAIDILITMQFKGLVHYPNPPLFDQAFILEELQLFKTWFLQAYLKLDLSEQEETLLKSTMDWLSLKLLSQPQTFIHRDYHSRNLMLTKENLIGVIDFQDAMLGPITYDLVSLLKDCYIQWPRDQVLSWVDYFYKRSIQAQQGSFDTFLEGFELCGLQRHLKVLGIFSRLHLRDNKSRYLNDLPQVLHYVLSCLETIKELTPFYHFMQSRVYLP